MTLNSALLEILQCPACSGRSFSENDMVVICKSCRKEYPIVAGIPDMRVYESTTYTDEFNRAQACYEAQLHDLEAEFYEEDIVRFFGTKTRLIAQDWAKELKDMDKPAVLDYGCGTGQISRVLRHYVSPLFAFDISPASVQRNASRNGVVGVVANAFFLPFRDRAFDMTCCNGVLHHIVDLPRAISELSRVSKGLVCISEGVPRARSVAALRRYPSVWQRSLFATYAALKLARRCGKHALRTLQEKVLHRSVRPTRDSKGSKYERPLEAASVESLLLRKGFTRRRLRYLTNIDWRADGLVKYFLTKALANDAVGTHFDLRMRRDTMC